MNARGHITAAGAHNVTIPSATASASANGLMSSTHYSKLEAIAANATADSAMTASEAEDIWDAA